MREKAIIKKGLGTIAYQPVMKECMPAAGCV